MKCRRPCWRAAAGLSLLETHRFDERGRGLEGSCPHRSDRFPHACENSLGRVLRSGLLVESGQRSLFEFHPWKVAERRGQAFLAVGLFEKHVGGRVCVSEIATVCPARLFVLRDFDEQLPRHIATGTCSPPQKKLRMRQTQATSRPQNLPKTVLYRDAKRRKRQSEPTLCDVGGWFGTKRSAVQIRAPRPFLSSPTFTLPVATRRVWGVICGLPALQPRQPTRCAGLGSEFSKSSAPLRDGPDGVGWRGAGPCASIPQHNDSPVAGHRL